MCKLNVEVNKFKSLWTKVYPNTVAPSEVEEIIKWHDANQEKYHCIRLITAAPSVVVLGSKSEQAYTYVDHKRKRYDHKEASEIIKLNDLINQSSIVEMAYRETQPNPWA